MADLTLTAIAHRQLCLLQQVTETLTVRALTSRAREDLDNLFLAQEHLEHWLQYLSPVALEGVGSPQDAPPPLPGLRMAPPLPHEQPGYQQTLEALMEESSRPRVSFPPEPLWVEDLERDAGEQEGEP